MALDIKNFKVTWRGTWKGEQGTKEMMQFTGEVNRTDVQKIHLKTALLYLRNQ